MQHDNDCECKSCVEQDFQKLLEQCRKEQARAEQAHIAHMAECPNPLACPCGMTKKPGTVTSYRAATYIGFHIYCRCDQPDYTPIVEHRDRTTGGICRQCDGSMPPRPEQRMNRLKLGDDVLLGPTYDSWHIDPETGELERGEAEPPVRVPRDTYRKMRQAPRSIIEG